MSVLKHFSFIVISSILTLDATFAGEHPAGEMPPTPVEVYNVKHVELNEKIDTIGNLLSEDSVVVETEIAGKVAEIYFKEGSKVQKGDKLLKLEDDALKAAYNKAAATFKLNQLSLTRNQSLFAKGFISSSALDEAKANIEVAKADLDTAKNNLSKTLILAPFDGVVGLTSLTHGSILKSGDKITNLEKTDNIKISFQVPEKDRFKVKNGDKVVIKTNNDNTTVEGEIYAIDPSIDQATRLVSVKAIVTNKDHNLFPGSFAKISLITSTEEVIAIPEECIMKLPNGNFVYIVKDGIANMTPVKLGKQMENSMVEILDGIQVGDVIVRAGHLKIADKAKVEAK